MNYRKARDLSLIQNRLKRDFHSEHRKFILTPEEQKKLEQAIKQGVKGPWQQHVCKKQEE